MIDPHSFDLVIFDCDGVLIDSEVIACRIDAEALTEAGYAITPQGIAERFIGLASGAMREIVEQQLGRALPQNFETELRRRTEAAYRQELRAIAGIAELLDDLAVPVCVASSSAPAKLRLGLELTGLLAHFEPHVFSSTMVARGKPAPDLFLYAAAQMGIRPERCVIVEDSLAGVQASVAAAMPVIGFTGGGHCPPGHGARLLAAGAVALAADAAALRSMLTGRHEPAIAAQPI